VLAVLFRNKAGGYLQPKWWGILGLIGWAYLWAALAYLLLRNEGFAALIGAVAVLMCVFIADKAGAFRVVQEFRFNAFGKTLAPGTWVNIGAHWGSQPAIVMAGAVIGWMLLPENADARPATRIRFAAVFAALLALAGVLLYSSYGINKNAATPTWCLFSAAITAVLWLGLYALVDAGGQRAWAVPIAWAGANALLIYIFAGLWYGAVSLFGLKWYGEMGAKYPEALGRAWVIAVALTVVGAGLGRIGFRLRV
jgi:predicted acyltransferase